jgi:DNA (cytosine-5)-methyltransferase 1
MRLGSLFDGIGGWLLAAKHAGITPVWASEIEKFPQSVTAHHFPDVEQLGDIAKLDGAKLSPVDIITAGSPCQDLSVAGKREGLNGARSGLFLRAIRLVHDMRRSSNGRYPRYFVWENVPGAFSSNRGLDFRAVLEEISQTEIPIPAGGRWASAGLAKLPGCDIAWRVLDAQYWGVPQRRKRIFLVADFGGHSAGEILFEPTGLSRHTAAGGKARQRVTARVESDAGDASVLRMRAGCAGGGKGALISEGKSLTLLNHNDMTLVVPNKARSLTARADGSPCIDRGPDIVAVYDMTHADELMRPVIGGKSNCLNSRMVTGGNQVPVVFAVGHDERDGVNVNIAGSLMETDYKRPCVVSSGHSIVRKLTPTEAERLQGLPDGYTDIPGASDTARYRALGNGMAQPCADYVIRRIVEIGGGYDG